MFTHYSFLGVIELTCAFFCSLCETETYGLGLEILIIKHSIQAGHHNNVSS